MKKIIVLSTILLAIVLLSGCANPEFMTDKYPTPPAIEKMCRASHNTTEISVKLVEFVLHIKGVEARVDILSGLLESKGYQVVRDYTDKEQIIHNGKTVEVGVWLSWYDDYPENSRKFIPLSDRVLQTEVCHDQELMALTFMSAKPKPVEKRVSVMKERKLAKIIIRVRQDIGEGGMFLKKGEQSRDRKKGSFRGSFPYTGRVRMKINFYDTQKEFLSPGEFNDDPFGGLSREIDFANEDGEYVIDEVDPCWLYRGYIHINSHDSDIVYPYYGVTMKTYPGELLQDMFNDREAVINFTYPVQK